MTMSKKNSRNERDRDVEVALQLYERLNPLGITENAVFPEDRNFGNYQPRTLIDQTLEIVDPTPNIYTLFGQFDAKFFASKLVSVEVRWSKRMTSCAGTCTFHPRSRECVISLSAPLLKLRPRKDLVETLLHEMIHGYLFLTNNNRDRSGHGPEFCKIMDRINREAGTRISIYHSFHDEVKLYQQHWWRCDGPCQKQPPYFGMVRRAMNRPPGPSDFWWASHQSRCNGRFVKVREPEKAESRAKSANENRKPQEKTSGSKSERKLDDWLTNTGVETAKLPISNDYNKRKTDKPSTSGLVKLGTSTNNVHGWGTGGPGSSCPSGSSTPKGKSDNGKSGRTLNFVGALGGTGTGKSSLLDKYTPPNVNTQESKRSSLNTWLKTELEHTPTKKPRIRESLNNDETRSSRNNPQLSEFHDCPVCNLPVKANLLNDHLDACLVARSDSPNNEKSCPIIEILDTPEKQRADRNFENSTRGPLTPLKGQTNLDSYLTPPNKKSQTLLPCPICDKVCAVDKFYDHFDACSGESNKIHESPVNIGIAKEASTKPEKSTKNHLDSYVCLVCNAKVSGDVALADHLDECVKSIFKDDTFDVGNDNVMEISPPKTTETKNKFNCPVCMDLIEENFMNQHLDGCLK